VGGELGGILIGWREAVVGLIVIVAIYMLVVALRMRRLRRKANPAPTADSPLEPVVAEGNAAASEIDAPDGFGTPAAWQQPPSRLAQDTFMHGVEDEVAQLRDEVDALRGELAALRDDLHNEIGHMRATQTVSPLYSDAMQMATLGHDAATIAERCGIARAEAELMVALIRSQIQGGAE